MLEGRVRGLVEDHRRGPVHQDPGERAGSPAVLGRDARGHAGAAGGDLPRHRGAIAQASGVDCSSVALDMTNFATFIGSGNGKAPVAQRGKAKQKRSDLRLAGLGLVVSRDGGIPLTWHAYPGDRPDVTQFPGMIDQLLSQYRAGWSISLTRHRQLSPYDPSGGREISQSAGSWQQLCETPRRLPLMTGALSVLARETFVRRHA